MAFNENLRKRREENGLTQQQLADKLYVSRQTVCRWENGSRCPDLITAKRLAVIFHVSLDALISDEDIRDDDIAAFKNLNKRIRWKGYQKNIVHFIETIGIVFLALSIFFSRYLHMTIPLWCTIVGIVIVGAAIAIYVVISKKLENL